MPYYVDVILPLPLADNFTYRLPEHYVPIVHTGSRVLVQFGGKHYYTAIVIRKHTDNPQSDYRIKDIAEVLDELPIVQGMQLQLWKWISDYYMCPIGEVYKAALPSGLKLESESTIVLNDAYVACSPLSNKELKLLESLKLNPKQRVHQLLKNCALSQGMQTIKLLLDKGAVLVDETMRQAYKPKSEVFVRVCDAYCSATAVDKALQLLQRAPKQQQMLLWLLKLGEYNNFDYSSGKILSRNKLLKESGLASAVLNALVAKGIVDTYVGESNRLSETDIYDAPYSLPPLSPHQQQAYNEITNVWESKDVCLLHGVTSSGKTEVYIHLIDSQLKKGRQTLLLVPEIALTKQITDRLYRVFGSRLGVYHSKISDSERVEIWNKQLGDNPYDVILGVRSSVFLPFNDLGLVIVDEEHETTYKQQEPAPRYHARSVAVMLAAYCKGKVLLGTATPSIESYYNAQCGKYGLVSMTERYRQVQLPRIEVVNLKDEYRQKRMYGPFSSLLHDTIHDALVQSKQIILFQNRRGYAPMLECAACGWVPRCDRCDVSLTYHHNHHQLVCHYCGNVYSVPVKCPSCASDTLNKRGLGTERIEEEVKRYFPTARVARMDMDTTRSKTAYDKIISDFQEQKTDVLIGTQMVSKGLDFDNVHVVGIMNADTMLNFPDFRSYERSFQLMAQVAGRAGRRSRQGMVVLQTRNVDLPVIQQVVTHDYASLYADQVEERELFHYPPFYRLMYIYIKGRDEASVVRAADAMVQTMRQYFGERVLGPEAPVVARIQSLYIRKIMFKTEPKLGIVQVRQYLYGMQQTLSMQGLLHGVTIYYDVDPY